MKNSLFAQFKDSVQAERAVATLVDRGGKPTDLTALFPQEYQGMGRFSALALLALPGLGWITGSGALATALSKRVGPSALAAMAGGVASCLVNHGLSQSIASDTANALTRGNAVLAVECPTGKLGELEVMDILSKYEAQTFARSGATRKVIYAI